MQEVKIENVYKIIQLLLPVIVGYITILAAQARWKNDGYLKRKIEIEMEINKVLVPIYISASNLSNLMKNSYTKDELIEFELELLNFRNKLFDARSKIFKLFNEYSLFRQDGLTDAIKSHWNEFLSKHVNGQYISLSPTSSTVGYFKDINDAEIVECSKFLKKFYKELNKLKKSICKNFKNL